MPPSEALAAKVSRVAAARLRCAAEALLPLSREIVDRARTSGLALDLPATIDECAQAVVLLASTYHGKRLITIDGPDGRPRDA